MKGFPLQNLIVVWLALAALAIPLLRVGRPASSSEAGSPAALAGPAGEAVPVVLRLRFVHPPQTVALSVEGKTVVLRGEGLERQGEAVLPEKSTALELVLKATWATGAGTTMVEVSAAPHGMAERAQNIWAEAGAVEELVRFDWRAAP